MSQISLNKIIAHNYTKLFVPFLAYLTATIVLLREVIYRTGVIGLKDDWSLSYFPEQLINQGNKNLFSWIEINQGVSFLYPSDLPIKILQSAFGYIGLDGDFFSKFLVVSTIVFAGFFMFVFLRHFKTSWYPTILGGLLYMFTPLIFQATISGYFSLLTAYCFFPLVLYFFFKAIDSKFKNLHDLILFGLVFSVIFIHIQFIFFTLAVFVMYIPYHYFVLKKRFSIKNFFIPIAIAISLNSFWIFPAILRLNTVNEFIKGGAKDSWIFLQNPTILESFFGWGSGYIYFQRTLEILELTNIWIISYVLIFILGLFLVVLKTDKRGIFFVILLALSVFVYKGENPPFEEIGTWLYLDTPLGSLLRNAQYLGILIIVPIVFIFSRFSTYFLNKFNNNTNKKILTPFFFIFITILVAINLSPWHTGDLMDQVNHVELNETYLEIEKIFSDDNTSFNVLYLPNQQPFSYDHGTVPSIQDDIYLSYGLVAGLNPMIAGSAYPTYGNLMSDAEISGVLSNMLSVRPEVAIYDHDVAKSLGFLNTKYVILTPEFNSIKWRFMPSEYISSFSPENKILFQSISNSSGLTKIKELEVAEIYENSKTYPRIYSSEQKVVLTGAYHELFEHVKNIDEKSSIIFKSDDIFINGNYLDVEKLNLDQYSLGTFDWNLLPENQFTSIYYPDTKYVVRTDGTFIDDTISFAELPYEQYLPSFSPDGWSAYNSTIIFLKTGDEPVSLFGVMEDDEIASTDPCQASFCVVGIWWETDSVGMSVRPISFPLTLPPNQKTIIQITGAAYNPELLAEYANDTGSTNDGFLNIENLKKTLTRNDVITKPPAILFQQINPTKYLVNTGEVSSPYIINLLTNFDPFWKITTSNNVLSSKTGMMHHTFDSSELPKQTSYNLLDIGLIFSPSLPSDNHILVNGYANGWFMTEDDGNSFVIYYLPQSYFYLGVLVSSLSLLFISLLLINEKVNLMRKSKHYTESNFNKNPQSLQILHVPAGLFKIPPDKGGGFEKHIANLIVPVSKLGHSVHVIAKKGSSHHDYDKIKFHEIPDLDFSFGAGFYGWIRNFLIGNFLVVNKLFTMILGLRNFDIIHCHDAITCIFILLIRKFFFRETAVVFSVHSTVLNPQLIRYTGIKNIVMRITIFLIVLAMRNVDLNITFTKVRQEELIDVCKIDPKKIIVIRQPIDKRLYENHKFDEITIKKKFGLSSPFFLYVGRLSKAKGVDNVIKALPLVGKHCVIVGDGSELKLLQKLADDLGVRDKVTFTGNLPHNDVISLYKMADFLVFPSYSEGFPLVIAEALSCGLPVISTNAAGISEIIKNNFNGFIFDMGNYKQLAFSINNLNDKKILSLMKSNASITIKQNFDLNKIIKQTIEAYHYAISKVHF